MWGDLQEPQRKLSQHSLVYDGKEFRAPSWQAARWSVNSADWIAYSEYGYS